MSSALQGPERLGCVLDFVWALRSKASEPPWLAVILSIPRSVAA